MKERNVRQILRNLQSTEAQAVAIYEAQIFWRGPGEEGIFQKILEEEKQHLAGLGITFSPISRLAGYFVGSFLAILPRKIRYRMHIWAEEEAANIYYRAAKDIKNPKLLEHLEGAARQEQEHARRFSLLLEKA